MFLSSFLSSSLARLLLCHSLDPKSSFSFAWMEEKEEAAAAAIFSNDEYQKIRPVITKSHRLADTDYSYTHTFRLSL